jgi:hypothetical protein
MQKWLVRCSAPALAVVMVLLSAAPAGAQGPPAQRPAGTPQGPPAQRPSGPPAARAPILGVTFTTVVATRDDVGVTETVTVRGRIAANLDWSVDVTSDTEGDVLGIVFKGEEGRVYVRPEDEGWLYIDLDELMQRLEAAGVGPRATPPLRMATTVSPGTTSTITTLPATSRGVQSTVPTDPVSGLAALLAAGQSQASDIPAAVRRSVEDCGTQVAMRALADITPLAGPAELLALFGSFREVGPVVFDGARVTRYSGTVDVTKVATMVLELVGGAPACAALAQMGGTPLPPPAAAGLLLPPPLNGLIVAYDLYYDPARDFLYGLTIDADAGAEGALSIRHSQAPVSSPAVILAPRGAQRIPLPLLP